MSFCWSKRNRTSTKRTKDFCTTFIRYSNPIKNKYKEH
nr:MAG TPA: hypothetical protein [Crassvirales sp.]